MKRLDILGAVMMLCAVCLMTVGCEYIAVDDTGTPSENPGDTDEPSDDGNDVPDTDEPLEMEVVFYDNLDRVIASGNVWNNFPGDYVNPTGTGVSGIAYGAGSRDVSVRSSYPSKGYEGASGGNGVYFGPSGYITVSGIALTQESDTYELSFGSYQYQKVLSRTSGDFKVTVAVDGAEGDGIEVLWDRPSSADWDLATAVIRFEDRVPETVRLKFAAGFSGNNNIRIDDLKLSVSDREPTQTISGNIQEPPVEMPWAELPNTLISNPDYRYVTHHATTYSSRKYVRNYTACYDTRRHNPVWVAFPFHDIYEEGGWTRPATDPWRPDPDLAESEQSIIYPADWMSYPNHTDTRRWSKLDGMYSYLGRGHLLASSSRGAGNKNVLLDLNMQTFYPTNISPESHAYPKHWELVEQRLTQWNCSDTVYVVTGCYYANDDNVIYDASWSGTSESYAKPCIVPTAHYKVFLRTKSGNTGKPVHLCTAGELMAIGFWFEQKLDSSPYETQPALSTVTMSVAEIESRIGGEFDFFPNVPDEVKETFNISDWPGLEDISSDTYPPAE